MMKWAITARIFSVIRGKYTCGRKGLRSYFCEFAAARRQNSALC
jgi:hypothetical protein